MAESDLKKILVVSTNEAKFEALKEVLQKSSIECLRAANLTEVQARLSSDDLIAVVIDIVVDSEKALKLCTYLHASIGSRALIFIGPTLLEKTLATSLQKSGMILLLGVGTNSTQEIAAELNERLNPFTIGYYNANVINCFVSAAHDVVDYYTGEEAKLGVPHLKYSRIATAGFVTGIMGIEGKEVEGSVSLTLDRKFAIMMTSRIRKISRSDAADQPNVIEEVANEICSQAFTKSLAYLNALGKKFEKTKSEVAIGEDHKIVHFAKNPAMLLPFSVEKYSFQLEYCLEKSL